MDRERLKNNNEPIAWQGDKSVTLRVRYEAGAEGGFVLVAREVHIQFGESCPVLAVITGESPATTRNLITALQVYSGQRLLNRRQDITLRWMVGELEKSFLSKVETSY